MRTLVSTGGVPYILFFFIYLLFFIFCAGGDISKTAKMLRLACSAVKKLFVGVSLKRFPVSGCGRITLIHRKAPKLWELLLLTPLTHGTFGKNGDYLAGGLEERPCPHYSQVHFLAYQIPFLVIYLFFFEGVVGGGGGSPSQQSEDKKDELGAQQGVRWATEDHT